MLRYGLLTLKIIVLLAIASAPALGGEFKGLSSSMQPYSINKGLRLNGISVDVLTTIMSMASTPMDKKCIKLVHYGHAIQTTRKGPKCVMLNAIKNKANATQFKWVGPMTVSRYVLIGKKEAEKDVAIPADMHDKTIATIFNSPSELALMVAGVSSDHLKRSSSHVPPLRELACGKVDYFATVAAKAAYLMKSMSMDPAQYAIVATYKEVPLYFAFSKDTSDKLIAKLNNALNEIKKNGPDGRSHYDKIVKKYLPSGMLK